MSTELSSSDYAELDSWPAGRILDAIIDSNRRAVEAVAAAVPQLELATQLMRGRLQAGGRIIYIGAGTSGRLAVQDAAELPPTFGFTRTLVLLAGGAEAGAAALEGAEDDADAAVRELQEAGVGPADVVIGVAASGRTPYTLAGIQAARSAGAGTIGVANNPDAPLLTAAEVPILVQTGPEVLAGSTRLAAGTAQKIVLNALSTTVLVQLGGAYGNLMVGMEPTNAKLRERAQLMVAQAADVDPAAALPALESSDWDIKTAIVMLRTGVSVEAARSAVAAAGGVVRVALEQLS